MRPLTAIAIVAIIAISAVAFYHFNGDSFDITDRQLVLVVTDSMDGDVQDYTIDSFPADTLVMVQHLTEQEKRFLRVGDVISYHSGGMLKQHRIVEADSGYYYVHGDNNHSTERVNLDQIDGKVVGASPWMGKSVVFVKDHFLLILAAMSLLCFAFIILAMSGRDPEKEAAR